MKLPAALIAVAFSLSAWGANTLDIPAGENYTVTPAQQRLVLDSLTIGDGARIRFAEGVGHWQLRASHAQIGADVVIEANGSKGADGSRGKSTSASAASCMDGIDGERGGDGVSGNNGVSLRMQLGLSSLGSLRIVSNGGAGGSGGTGGAGQAAGEFSKSCRNAPEGGTSGDGGNGGHGGNGGDITVLFWSADSKLDVAGVPGLIQIESKSGAAGAGGQSGEPGAGSEGHYIQKRTLAGNRSWVGGGEAGSLGRVGLSGGEGQNGRVLVEQALFNVPSQSVATAKPSAEPTNRDEEIRAIRQSLKALLQRLERLEQQ